MLEIHVRFASTNLIFWYLRIKFRDGPLRSPRNGFKLDSVFVLSFEGDDEVGSGGIAVAFLKELLTASICGELRIDSYMDEDLVQPSIEVIDGRKRRVIWPRVLIYRADLPALSKRIYLASFPSMKKGWGNYCHAISETIASFNPDVVVLLGSIVSTDRQPYFGRVLARSNSPKLMRDFGLFKDKSGGFTGSLGAVQVILEGYQLPTVSMWLTAPISEAHEADVRGALELIEAIEKMFNFKVCGSDLKFDPAGVFATGTSELNEIEATGDVGLWSSQADFLDLQDLVGDFSVSSRELIEEAEEYLRDVEE